MAKKKEKSEKKNPEDLVVEEKDSAKKEKKKKAAKKTPKPTLKRAAGRSVSPEVEINKEALIQIDPTEVSLRAYFIGQNRINQGLSGDSLSDWVTAETELREESRNKGLR